MEPDRNQFREAMCRIGAAVNVVTSDGPAGRCGTTMTAVSSVTDTPATLLVCVNRLAWANQVIRENGNLCVNVLAAEDAATANLFAGMTQVPHENRFDDLDWHELVTGAPVLPGVLVACDCRVQHAIEVGTHTIFLAEVVKIEIGPARDGLIYFQRRYGAVHELAS